MATPPDLRDPDAQATYIDMAFVADDPRMVRRAIKDVATLLRVPCALEDNPRLSEVMQTLRDLGLGLTVARLEPPE